MYKRTNTRARRGARGTHTLAHTGHNTLLHETLPMEMRAVHAALAAALCVMVCAAFGVFWAMSVGKLKGMRGVAARAAAASPFSQWVRRRGGMAGVLDPVGERPVLWMTYHEPHTIPAKVFDALDKYAPRHDIRIVDDAGCVASLRALEGKAAVTRFRAFAKGAHKADLWRYCILFHKGGTYLDVKTRLVRPLSEMFPPNSPSVTAKSIMNGTLYQGIIHVAAPRDPMLHALFRRAMSTPDALLAKHYLALTQQFYDALQEAAAPSYGTLRVGRVAGTNWELWQEVCFRPGLGACWWPDRYFRCCTLENAAGETMCDVRYEDFPW